MATNPLLGKRISLVSKKNIRYEGVLYSINEQNATVALQNVRSYGTEGREKAEGATFVAPSDAVHPYLLFRGQDIKDLHVHEDATSPPEDPAVISTQIEPSDDPKVAMKAQQPEPQKATKNDVENRSQNHPNQRSRQQHKTNVAAAAVGTGASLLNRKERGVVSAGGRDDVKHEFDFQTNLENFKKEKAEEEEAGDHLEAGGSYQKDDFFDSISCEALDREAGVDNRVRGASERHLNTETFGAVALNSHHRRRKVGGGAGDRGGGRGRGRGRGRGGRGRGTAGSQSGQQGSRRSVNPPQQSMDA